jgi:hypothetical protein
MVLAYWGDDQTEAALVKQLETKRYGTPIRNVERLRESGYEVFVGSLSRVELESHLGGGKPVIARVWTTMLDYWDVSTSHVVVVVGSDDSAVFLTDPAYSPATSSVPWDSFLAAWAEYDETAVIISKSNQ